MHESRNSAGTKANSRCCSGVFQANSASETGGAWNRFGGCGRHSSRLPIWPTRARLRSKRALVCSVRTAWRGKSVSFHRGDMAVIVRAKITKG